MEERAEQPEKNSADAGGAASRGREDRLFEAVQHYLHEMEQGRRPSRQEWVARYPDLSPQLDECLDALNFMRDAASGVQPGGSRGSTGAAGLRPGMPIGDFEIVREIGRGGMGIVYEAVQLSLGRHVALKTLPFATGLDPKYLLRFRQEAQAAARLHHPNIVPVYAVGCERGVNFYAMQLIDGQSLDAIIRQLSGASRRSEGESSSGSRPSGSWSASRFEVPSTEPLGSGPAPEPSAGPTSRLGVVADTARVVQLSADLSSQIHRSEVYRTIANLMAQAADALEYAHQQGIVHRDIKPANLMVDMSLNLWVADFGLAYLQSEQGLTRTGELLGTIRYASPEQVSGQRVVLDHRTDLYSLGATFYELLTLRPVFAGATRQALLQQILNHEPVALRSIERTVPPELETIVLKLLSKRPEERYGSAREVAEDLRRFVRDEPILARPPSLMERLRKWGRRHPAYLVALAIVVVAVLVASGVSNWLIAQANRRTKEALNAELAQAAEAERNLQRARQAVDYMIQVSENDLATKFPLHPLQRRILEMALVYYQGFIGSCHGNPVQEAELVAVQQRLKKVLDELSLMEGAIQLVLLGEKDVQADLKLDPAERERFGAIAGKFVAQRTEMLQGFQTLSLDDRRARFVELARNGQQVAHSVLTRQQIARLKQIILQLHGITAFNEPEIATSLTLTEIQAANDARDRDRDVHAAW